MKIEEDDRMKNIWKYYCYIGIIIWMFSTIFHSRDFWLTELLDYFGAFGIVCYTFYVSIIFTFPWLQRNQDGLKINYFIAGCLIAFYSTRVLLFLTGIDYGLNMFYCIILSIITGIIYITWILKEIIQGKKRESLKYLGIIIGIGLISACFEILDFPPILWIIDAHSIFHALTIPTPLLLAKFAYEESEYEQGRRKMVIGKYV
uniref:Post-GPI attachment to proteins factor 3 n=2 Tax=Panagrolaimus sp. JU765 TaxID=591449 RepID=A0AC34QVM5_9BILA